MKGWESASIDFTSVLISLYEQSHARILSIIYHILISVLIFERRKNCILVQFKCLLIKHLLHNVGQALLPFCQIFSQYLDKQNLQPSILAHYIYAQSFYFLSTKVMHFALNYWKRHWISNQCCKVTQFIIAFSYNPWNDALTFFQPNFLHHISSFGSDDFPIRRLKLPELKINLIELFWCKIINVKPVIIPRVDFSCLHLRKHLTITKERKVTYSYFVTAFYYRLALTKDCEVAVCTISYSKLLSCADNFSMSAVPDKYTRLTRSNYNSTVLTFINVDTGCSIEQKYKAFLAVRYLKLLHLEFSWLTYQRLKPPVLEQKVLSPQLFLYKHNINNDQPDIKTTMKVNQVEILGLQLLFSANVLTKSLNSSEFSLNFFYCPLQKISQIQLKKSNHLYERSSNSKAKGYTFMVSLYLLASCPNSSPSFLRILELISFPSSACFRSSQILTFACCLNLASKLKAFSLHTCGHSLISGASSFLMMFGVTQELQLGQIQWLKFYFC